MEGGITSAEKIQKVEKADIKGMAKLSEFVQKKETSTEVKKSVHYPTHCLNPYHCLNPESFDLFDLWAFFQQENPASGRKKVVGVNPPRSCLSQTYLEIASS